MSKSIVKNTFYKFLLSVFNVIIPVLVGPYINWLLDKEQLALYSSATTMMNFFLIFASFGIYNYGIREINRVRDDKPALSRLFTNLFCFGAATTLLTSLCYLLYVLFAVEKSQQLVFGVMLIQILANTFMVEWLNEALENYGFITKKTMAVRLISTALLFLIVRHPDDVLIYASLVSVTVLVNNLSSFAYIKRRVPFDFSGLHPVHYLKPLTIMLIIANINYLYTQLDRLFLMWGVGQTALTEYTKPSDIINMLLLVVQSFLIASVPRLSYYVSHDQEADYNTLLDKSSRSYFMLVYPLCVGLFCLSYEAVYFYASPKWIAAVPVMQTFSIRCIITSVYSIFTNQILYLHGRERDMVRILAAGGFLNLLCDTALLLTHTLTPVSAIASTGFAELIMLSVMYAYIRKEVQVEFKLFSFKNLKYLLYSLLFLPITWGVRLLSLGPALTAALAVLLCGGCYGLLLLVTKDEMLFFFLHKIRARFLGTKK